MSKALPGSHLCKDHQGNHSHYATKNCVICQLKYALQAAQAHLEYCGYGDLWERSIAREQKLEEKIKKALLA
jgi:hypothetical protein